MKEDLASAIAQRTARVGIIGLGYVGLPLVRAFYEAGFSVIGFDVDERKIERLAAGESYIQHIGADFIARGVKDKRFSPTADMRRLAEADCLLICVPTPLTGNREPDLSYVESTAQDIAVTLRPGQLVVLESTTYPGTTRKVVLPILQTSGLKEGKDFFLAYSPEREDPGNAEFSARSIPKVVGGLDAQSLELANSLYSQAVERTVPVSSCEVAEACKILENTYRSVNIAMVNELKVLFERLGIDVWEVIEAAKTKPFGFQPFYPGPGLGGHCIPIDPFYLSWVARQHGTPARFIELAGEVNRSMPQHVVNRVSAALEHQEKTLKGSKILVLGVAYKRDIDDPRESPAFAIMELLADGGARLAYNDPHVPQLPTMRSFRVPALTSEEVTQATLQAFDCTVIVTDHSAYDYEQIVKYAPLVIDTRNATKNITAGRDKIWKA